MGVLKRVAGVVKGTASTVTGALGKAKDDIVTENPDSVLGDVAGTVMDAGRSVARRVSRNAAGAKVDWRALSDAALEGSGLRNRKGEFKAWRVARTALWPVNMLKDVGTEVAKEAFRQRRSLKDLIVELRHGLPEDPGLVAAEQRCQHAVLLDRRGHEPSRQPDSGVRFDQYDIGIHTSTQALVSVPSRDATPRRSALVRGCRGRICTNHVGRDSHFCATNVTAGDSVASTVVAAGGSRGTT